VDLSAGVLTVIKTKFHKSRLVLVHESTTSALRNYAKQRDSRQSTIRSETFFVNRCGSALSNDGVQALFRALRRRLGWTGHLSRPPMIQDLRHTFAVRRLLLWYEEGADVNHKIAALSTYLGHVNVSNTYWYLTAVPELMAVTSACYERFACAQAEEIAYEPENVCP
jgi:integrase